LLAGQAIYGPRRSWLGDHKIDGIRQTIHQVAQAMYTTLEQSFPILRLNVQIHIPTALGIVYPRAE
jgi:hypothetical protein